MRRRFLAIVALVCSGCIGPGGEICVPFLLPPRATPAAPAPQEPAPAQQGESVEGESQSTVVIPRPVVDLNLSFSNDAAWFHTRTHVRHSGYVDAELFFNDDDDFAFHVGLDRIERVSAYSRFSMGVGIGFYGAFLDEPDDNIGALVLSGIVSYDFPTEIPARFATEASFSPDVTTFGDGESLLDVVAGFEIAVGKLATAMAGYRLFQVDVDSDSDYDLDEGAFFGVRIGF